MSTLKDGFCLPVPVNVNLTLFGNKIFVDDQVKLGSLGWALIQNDFILIKKGDLDTEIPTGRKPCGEEGRDRDNASVRQGTPAMASEPPEDRGQAWDRLSLLERNSSADTGVLDFQPPDCEKLSFFYCKPPSW